MELNELSYQILSCVYKVHSRLGSGLLESTYEVCLAYELEALGLFIQKQQAQAVVYDDIKLDAGYRLDIVVERKIVCEIKSVEAIAPIHQAQLLTYLKLSNLPLGLLLNFNVVHMKEGIKRIIN